MFEWSKWSQSGVTITRYNHSFTAYGNVECYLLHEEKQIWFTTCMTHPFYLDHFPNTGWDEGNDNPWILPNAERTVWLSHSCQMNLQSERQVWPLSLWSQRNFYYQKRSYGKKLEMKSECQECWPNKHAREQFYAFIRSVELVIKYVLLLTLKPIAECYFLRGGGGGGGVGRVGRRVAKGFLRDAWSPKIVLLFYMKVMCDLPVRFPQ